jgi:hypothetical protein
MDITHKLAWLNSGNGTSKRQLRCIKALPSTFPNDEIIALEVGCAYGGGAEIMGKILYGKGKVYGYDTFEGHPKDLADKPTDLEATCMDPWYENPEYGRDKLSYEYQCKMLSEQGLDNVTLVKGRINEHSFDDIEKVHFAILDMDLVQPTKIAYEALKDKFVKGGYLFLHDAVPKHRLVNLSKYLYKEVIYNERWELIGEHSISCVVILKRI